LGHSRPNSRLLAEDAKFAMPRTRAGVEAATRSPTVAHAQRASTAPALVPTRANGQLALGVYRRESHAGRYLLICLDVLAHRARASQ
jgi:hypothetical protein